jgi:hypothetical protein|tara:strand:+ start:4800 stop:4982 length:183 start_codon:yes stop_codon:yes gene_type:complete
MSEQKCICGDVISEDKLEEFSSEELQALNNLLDGNCTQKEIEVLTRFITDAPKVQGVSNE